MDDVVIAAAPSVYLGELPLWKGVQAAPAFEALPFALRVDRGIIRLDSSLVDTARIVSQYADPEYAFISTPPGCSSWGNRLGDWYVGELARAVGDLAGKTVLEIGAGTTYIGERVRERLHAARYVICDPALTPAHARPGIEIVREYFSYALFRHERIDLVVSINNLEHIVDPHQYLRDVRQLLEATGGRCFVVVPECSRGLREGDWGVCVHEHLSYFTERSFAATAAATGLALRSHTVADDTLFALLEPAASTAAPSDEEERRLLAAAAGRFRENVGAVSRALTAARKGGAARIGFHGCSVGLNNVLGLLGLRSAEDVYLFDGDESKTGRYLPAFDHPILSAKDPSYGTMTHLIVAAMTYFDEIRAAAVSTHGFAEDRVLPFYPSA